MTEHAAGGKTQDQDLIDITERIHRNAALEGADLTDPMTLAGFLGSIAAVLALAQHDARLPDDQARAHAQAMLDLVDALAVDIPNFNTGWNASLAIHSSMMTNAVKAGELTQEAKGILFDVDARLLHNG